MVLRSGADAQEVLADRDVLVEGVGQRLFRGDGVLLGGEDVLAEHGQARAGAAYGNAAIDQELDGLSHRRPAPQPHVIPLIAAGDEERFGAADLARDERIARGLGRVDHDALDGIDLAEPVEIGVVPVAARSAQHDNVAAARAFEEPPHDRVLVLAAAHQREPGFRGRLNVGGIAGEEILVRRLGARDSGDKEAGTKSSTGF